MSWIFIVFVTVVILAFVILKLLQRGVFKSDEYPYQSKGMLFSPAERSFYGVLSQAVGETAIVFGKVRVADVMVPKKVASRSEWQIAFNKISGKHFDFLLCDTNDLSVICAIELDDSSHQSKERMQRDVFLEGVCSSANVPLIRVFAKSGYVIGEVREMLAPYLTRDESLGKDEIRGSRESVPSEKTCPKCSSLMVMRVAKKGVHAGKQFWACSAFPGCKHIEAINT